MTFLMMLSVILQSMLMILLYILSVIGHLICGNNLNWLLNLNLIYETQWTGVRSGLLISMLGRFSWFHLTSLITTASTSFFSREVYLLSLLIDCMIFLSPFLHVTRMSMSTVSFLAQLNSGILYLL